MGFRQFLTELSDDGRIRLADDYEPTTTELAACDDLILRQAQACALDIAADAPPLRIEAARWAAAMMYRGCVFMARREVEPQVVTAGMLIACPIDVDARTVYSADLYMRYLPDLIALARGLAEDDPLVAGLIKIAAQWPLSSVGVRGLKTIDSLAPIFDHAGLRQLYVDRIIERTDASRITDPAVRAAITETAGLYPQLTGHLALSLIETPAPVGTDETSEKGPREP